MKIVVARNSEVRYLARQAHQKRFYLRLYRRGIIATVGHYCRCRWRCFASLHTDIGCRFCQVQLIGNGSCTPLNNDSLFLLDEESDSQSMSQTLRILQCQMLSTRRLQANTMYPDLPLQCLRRVSIIRCTRQQPNKILFLFRQRPKLRTSLLMTTSSETVIGRNLRAICCCIVFAVV